MNRMNTIKRTGSLLLTGALGLLAGCQLWSEAAHTGKEGTALAAAGATPYVITVSADATAPEKTAANELAAYLKKITGAEFARVAPAAAAGRPVVAVGPGAAKAVAPELDLARTGPTGLGEDGIVLQAVARTSC
jgi:hypothetical protein